MDLSNETIVDIHDQSNQHLQVMVHPGETLMNMSEPGACLDLMGTKGTPKIAEIVPERQPLILHVCCQGQPQV